MAIQPLQVSTEVPAIEAFSPSKPDWFSRRSVKRMLFLAGDLVALSLAYYAAAYAAKALLRVSPTALGPVGYPLLFVPFCAAMFYVMDGYGAVELRRPEREIELAFKAVSFSLLSLFATNAILLKGEVFSRYFILLWWALTLAAVLWMRFGLRTAYSWLWSHGKGRSRALFFGEPYELEHFQRLLSVQNHKAYSLISSTVVSVRLHATEPTQYLNDLNSWQDVAQAQGIQVVILGHSVHESVLCREVVRSCALRKLNVVLLDDTRQPSGIHQELDHFTGSACLTPASPWGGRAQRLCKRCIDVFFGVIGTAITLLLTPLVALIIVLEDPGPIFYRREIVSGTERRLWHWKFRTMVKNADTILQNDSRLMAQFAENHKLADDPRVLRVGRFLRKYSIDELPQLFGLLSGDFSLVGPRGISFEEGARYGEFLPKRMSVKPGITGYWQVMGRQLISYEDRVRMDEFYIDHWSIWLDLYIIGKTFGKLLRPEGAY